MSGVSRWPTEAIVHSSKTLRDLFGDCLPITVACALFRTVPAAQLTYRANRTMPVTYFLLVAAAPMSFEFVIDTDAQIIRETWTGSIDLPQLKDSSRQEWAHRDYQKHLHMISDFRAAVVELTSSEMWTFVRWFAQTESLGKFALVVSREVGFGVARMFSSISEDTKYSDSMRVFYSLEAAEAWILSNETPANP